MVSWFHRFRGVKGLVVSWVSRCQRFGGFIGFTVSKVPWFHRLRGVKGFMHGFLGFIVSWVSWCHRFRGVKGFFF